MVESRRSRRSNGPQPEGGALTGESKEISLAGGRFSVVGELWVSSSVLNIPRPEGVDPLSPTCYNSGDPAAGNQGVIAELYQDLPLHLQNALANDNWRVAFKALVLLFFMSFTRSHD